MQRGPPDLLQVHRSRGRHGCVSRQTPRWWVSRGCWKWSDIFRVLHVAAGSIFIWRKWKNYLTVFLCVLLSALYCLHFGNFSGCLCMVLDRSPSIWGYWLSQVVFTSSCKRLMRYCRHHTGQVVGVDTRGLENPMSPCSLDNLRWDFQIRHIGTSTKISDEFKSRWPRSRGFSDLQGHVSTFLKITKDFQ